MIKFKECSPQFTFLLFLVFLSWIGPSIIFLGAGEGDFIIILTGFFITIFLWLFIGINSFCKIFPPKEKSH